MFKTLPYKDTTLFYRLTGVGKTVVLLHGFGEDSRIWESQVDFLKNHCRLLVPDLPGSGKSALLKSGKPVGMEDYACCIKAILDKEQIESCIMLGHSMGGYITLAFAKKFPAYLTGFGLIHSTAFADSEEKKISRSKAIEFLEKFGVGPFLKNTIPNLFGNHFKNQFPEKIAALIQRGESFSKEALQQYYRAMMERPDYTAVLKSNGIPVLFVMGTDDIAAPMADVLKQVSLPDISYIYVMPDIGHMSMLEAGETLNGQLFDFIH
ncbi:MAG: hypothetical protein RLZZ28_2308 [Bacteroidota bacterium]